MAAPRNESRWSKAKAAEPDEGKDEKNHHFIDCHPQAWGVVDEDGEWKLAEGNHAKENQNEPQRWIAVFDIRFHPLSLSAGGEWKVAC